MVRESLGVRGIIWLGGIFVGHVGFVGVTGL